MNIINVKKSMYPFYSGFITIKDQRYFLNNNDIKLLIFCAEDEYYISEIARHLEIAPKNVLARLDKLLDIELIESNTYGTRRRFIKTINCKFCATKQEDSTHKE